MNAFHGFSRRKLFVGQPPVGRVVTAAVVVTAATIIANDHRNNIALRMMVRQERLTHHGRGGGIVDHQYKISSSASTCLGGVIEKETSHKGLESSVVGGHFHRGDPRVRFGL